MPPIWKTKPQNSNLISPKDAMTTPRTIMETLPRTLRLGGEMPKAQVASRTATAVVAWERCQSDISFFSCSRKCWLKAKTHLKHLDEGHTQREVRQVSRNERKAEHDTDRDNRAPGQKRPSAIEPPSSSSRLHPHVCLRGHRDLMAGVEGLGEASHVLGHDGAEDLVPCRQEKRCGRGSTVSDHAYRNRCYFSSNG